MDRFLMVALAAVVDGGRILLLRRKRPPYRGYWSLPGGKIRFGETALAAAAREAEEETGLAVRRARLAGAATEIIRAPGGEPEAHFSLYLAELHPAPGEPRAGAEGELRWFLLEELEAAEMIPSDRDMVRRFVAAGGAGGLPHYEVVRRGESYELLLDTGAPDPDTGR